MRTIFTLLLAASALLAVKAPAHAAMPVDALLTTLEAADPDRSLVAVCDGEHIVLLPSPVAMVEVRAAAKHSPAAVVAQFPGAAGLVGSLARTATA